MTDTFSRIALVISMLIVAGCGFKPIYAEPESGAAPVNKQIAIGSVSAPEEVHLFVTDALRERIVLRDGDRPKYELSVFATEGAQRLAVQIDATVTRYNYRLNGRYQLVDLEDGAVYRGKARAITSYNIVSSQYSTLFAERAAREKAARLLAEEIERDILLRLSSPDARSVESEPDELDDPATIEEIGDPKDSFSTEERPFTIGETPESRAAARAAAAEAEIGPENGAENGAGAEAQGEE